MADDPVGKPEPYAYDPAVDVTFSGALERLLAENAFGVMEKIPLGA